MTSAPNDSASGSNGSAGGSGKTGLSVLTGVTATSAKTSQALPSYQNIASLRLSLYIYTYIYIYRVLSTPSHACSSLLDARLEVFHPESIAMYSAYLKRELLL